VFDGSKVTNFAIDVAYNAGNDRVLIAVDSAKDYVKNLQAK